MEQQELSLQASVETIVFHKFILRIVHRRETLLPVLPEHLLPIGVHSLFMADERSHWKQCTVLSCVTGSLYYAKLHYSTVVETTRRNRNNNASKWIRGV